MAAGLATQSYTTSSTSGNDDLFDEKMKRHLLHVIFMLIIKVEETINIGFIRNVNCNGKWSSPLPSPLLGKVVKLCQLVDIRKHDVNDKLE
jgi:hypothetical protein